MRDIAILVFLGCLAVTRGMYGPSDSVVELTPSNFDNKVVKGDGIWVVEFYAPWCGHCQQFAPEYKKLAKAVKGIFNVGAVDASEHQSLGSRYGVQGFPTIKIFGLDKNKPDDYNDERKAEKISSAVFRAMREVISSRLGLGGGSGGRSGGGSADEKDVVVLSSGNFEKTVLNSDDMWLVEFYAPWCGHCKNLAPHWAAAATELKGKVKLGKVDATVEQVLSSKYGIKGFPTIKYFPAGKKDWDSGQEYTGGRTSDTIVSWALDKYSSQLPPPEIYQLTDQSVMDKCTEKQLCFISFLPNILDSMASGRNQYLDTAREIAEKYKQRSFGWVWIEGGVNIEVEGLLDVGGSGYPALAAVNARKSVYSTMKGPYNDQGIKGFIRELGVGRGTAALRNGKLPSIPITDPWDGKDGVLPVDDEDYDLSDVEFDDDDDVKDEL